MTRADAIYAAAFALALSKRETHRVVIADGERRYEPIPDAELGAACVLEAERACAAWDASEEAT